MSVDIDRLIASVYARPAIWDTANDAHHNRFILDKLWEEVSKEVGCSKVNVKSKWKYLRDNFRKELGKQGRSAGDSASESGEANSDKIRSSWPYYVSLLFLRDQFGGRRTAASAGNQPEYEEDLSGLLEVSYEEETGEATSTAGSFGDEDASVRQARKRPALDDELYSLDRQRIDRMIREKLTGGSAIKQEVKQPDSSVEDVKFFESLLPHVAKIPANQKLVFRSKVQDLTHQFAYGPILLPCNASPQTTQE